MLTDNSTETDQSPDDFFAAGVHAIPGMDVSNFRPDPLEDNTTEKIDKQERGTADPDETKTESKDSNNTSNEDTSTAETNAPLINKGRSNNRIQELIAQIKERDAKLAEHTAKIAEYEKAKSQVSQPEPVKQTEVPALIPKPKYEVKDLEGLKTKYEDALEEHRINGDLAKIKETREYLRMVNEELEQAKTWESRNKAEMDKHSQYLNHYRNEILNKWPEMKDEKSPIRQEYAKVHAEFTELQKNPALLEYRLASLASLRLNAAKASLLEEQNKKLQQEIASLKEKRKPLSQEEAPSTGGANEDADPSEELRSALKGLGRGRFT